MREPMNQLALRAKENGDDGFLERESVNMWMSERTGIPMEKMRQISEPMSERFFGIADPKAAWGQISASYEQQDAIYEMREEAQDKVESDVAFRPLYQLQAAVVGGLESTASYLVGGLTSQYATLLETPLISPHDDEEFASLSNRFGHVDLALDLAGVLDKTEGPSLTGEWGSIAGHAESVTRREEIAKRIDGENIAKMAEFDASRRGKSAAFYREWSDMQYKFADEVYEMVGSDEKFRGTLVGQMAAGVGSLPVTAVMAMAGPLGWVGMESMMFGQAEAERREFEGADYDPTKAWLDNTLTAAPQAILERTLGIERVFANAWRVTPKVGAKVSWGDYLRNLNRRGLTAGSEEAVVEPLQGQWGDFIAKHTFDEKRELFSKETVQIRGMEAVAAFGLGYLFGGAISVDLDIQRNEQIDAGQNYLLTKHGGLLTTQDFKIMRSVYTDEEIVATAPDEEMGKMLLDAANGDKDSFLAYQQETVSRFFEPVGGKTKDGWQLGKIHGKPAIIRPDNSPLVFNMNDPEQADLWDRYTRDLARTQRRDRRSKEERDRADEGTEAVVDELQKRHGEKLKVSRENIKSLRQQVTDKDITQQQMDDAIEVAIADGQLDADIDPDTVQVLGKSSLGTNAEGHAQMLISLAKTATPATVIEENGEGWLKLGYSTGQLSKAEVREARRNWFKTTGDADPASEAKDQDRADTEWFSSRLTEYALSNRKTILGVDAGSAIGKWLITLGNRLRTMLKGASKMKKLMRDGKLDPKLEAWFLQALGDKAAIEQQKVDDVTVKAMQETLKRVARDVDIQMLAENDILEALDIELSVQADRILKENIGDVYSLTAPADRILKENIGDIYSLTAPDTAAFKEWFGDSKVVDKDGKPLAVMNAAIAARRTLRLSPEGEFVPGFYFTGVHSEANVIATKTANVTPVYLRIENPAPQSVWQPMMERLDAGTMTRMDMRRELDDAGYDGIIQPHTDHTIYVTFQTTQTKSATGNRGTFDGTNPDITYSLTAMSEVSDKHDGSRVGTATRNKSRPRTRDTNVSMANVTDSDLAKQMAMMTHYTKKKVKKGKAVGVDAVMPEYITKIKDPVKKRDAILKMMVDNLNALYEAFPEELRERSTFWYDGARVIADNMANDTGLSPEQSAAIIAAFSPMKDWFQNVQMALNFGDVFANELDSKVTYEDYGPSLNQIADIPKGAWEKKTRREIFSLIKDRSIREVWESGDHDLAAWMTRIVSTQKHGLYHDVLAPEGFSLGVRLNNDGDKKVMVWQDTSSIVKALKVGFDGSPESISEQLGEQHKIRNFNNNIIAPNSGYGDATIDTHAVNAGLLYPQGGSGYQVGMNFGDAGVAGPGNSGNYWLHLEAVQRAAKDQGIMPRQMQSVTWEAIRMLFPDASKRNKSFVDKYAQIWKNSKNAEEARTEILQDPIGATEWSLAGSAGAAKVSKAGARKNAKYEALGLGTLRPTVRSGSTARAPDVISDADETYQLTGIPVNETQSIESEVEAMGIAENLAKDEVIKNLQQAETPSERIKRINSWGLQLALAKTLVPLSGRLQRLALPVAQRLRRMEMNIGKQAYEDIERIRPFLEGLKKIRKTEDFTILDLALKNGDTDARDEILEKYGIDITSVEELLADIRKRLTDAGYDVGQIDNYFPRKVDDLEGLAIHYEGKVKGTRINQEIKKAMKAANKAGRSFSVHDEELVLNSYLNGRRHGKAGPSSTKKRVTVIVEPEANIFYADSMDALMRHIQRAAESVEQSKFFGKHSVRIPHEKGSVRLGNFDVQASVGLLVQQAVDDGDLDSGQQEEVKAMIEARFNQGVTDQWARNFKDLGYITTMGQITSTIVQLTDLAFSIYENGWAETMVAAGDAIAGRSRVTRERLGVESINADFSSPGKLHEAVNRVFTITGLKAFDRVGKETLMNAKLNKLQKQAARGELDQKAEDILAASFTSEQAAQVRIDLAAGVMSDDVMFLGYNTLANYQPINLSEFPEAYLRMPNGRALYMLKTFTIKQLEAFRREGMEDFLTGKTTAIRARGLKNFMHLAGIFWLIGVPVDWIKDMMRGRPVVLNEIMLDNLLKLGGISSYNVTQFRREPDPVKFVMGYVAPPAPWLLYPLKDLGKGIQSVTNGDEYKPAEANSWRMVPVLGGIYHDRLGAGRNAIKRRSKKPKPPSFL